MANCSTVCISSCELPADIQAAMSGALACKVFNGDEGASQTFNPVMFCRAVMSAVAPDSVMAIDLDDVRSLLGQGRIHLGYSQSFINEGTVIKACKALTQRSLNETPDLLHTASGILVMIRTPPHAAIKLSEIRTGLREMWQHIPDTAQSIYAYTHSDSLTDTVEIYTLVASESSPEISYPHLVSNHYLTLDECFQKLARLGEQTNTDLILLQSTSQILAKYQKSSIGFIQRKLKIGYSLASKLLQQLEREGIVSPLSSEGRRSVLVRF